MIHLQYMSLIIIILLDSSAFTQLCKKHCIPLTNSRDCHRRGVTLSLCHHRGVVLLHCHVASLHRRCAIVMSSLSCHCCAVIVSLSHHIVVPSSCYVVITSSYNHTVSILALHVTQSKEVSEQFVKVKRERYGTGLRLLESQGASTNARVHQ